MNIKTAGLGTFLQLISLDVKVLENNESSVFEVANDLIFLPLLRMRMLTNPP